MDQSYGAAYLAGRLTTTSYAVFAMYNVVVRAAAQEEDGTNLLRGEKVG